LLDTHAQKTALRLGVPAEAVRSEFRKSASAQFVPAENEFEPEIPADLETPRPSPLEFYLLKLLFLHDDLVAWAAEHLDLNWVSHLATRQTIDQRLAAHEHGTWQNLGAFLDGCESAEQRSLITEAVAEERKIPNLETQLADLTLKLRNQFLDRQIGALTQRISQQADDDEKVALLREQLTLKELKRSPLQPLPK
jgi:hypothetical protein